MTRRARRVRRWWVAGLFALAVWLALPAAALASTARLSPTQVLPWQQLWPLLIGAVVPLATYALNHWAPWVSQPVKALVLVVLTAVATAVYTALATHVFGFNAPTLQLVVTGIVGALGAHHLLWKPSGVSTLLGAYADYGVAGRVGRHGPPGHPAPRPPGPREVPPAMPTV